MSNMFSLEGKIALVTGASYGIGFAIACAMSDAGATIVFNDIKQELVDKGIAAYAEKGIKAHGYVCDVTDEAAVNALVAKIEEEVGVIDILVNNAGIIKRIPMCEMTAEQFRQAQCLPPLVCKQDGAGQPEPPAPAPRLELKIAAPLPLRHRDKIAHQRFSSGETTGSPSRSSSGVRPPALPLAWKR